MLRAVINFFYNSFGFKTNSNSKLVVFCSDDWGGVRVRSNADRNALQQAGIDMNRNRFDQFDTIESEVDLEQFFAVIEKYKDYEGNHPVVTAVMNVANPDFERIKKEKFNTYYYEPFTKTFERYRDSANVLSLYKYGISTNIFKPQFHGREHLQIIPWMNALRKGDLLTSRAFENEFFFLPQEDVRMQMAGEYAEAFNYFDSEEISVHKEVIENGLAIFEEQFGYKPIYFIPPAMQFSDALNQTLAAGGVKLIDVARWRKIPKGRGAYGHRLHFMGQKNQFGQIYIHRNVVFEPNLPGCGADACLAQIQNTFRNRQPAIISNHRAAFVGGLSSANRQHGMQEFSTLLHTILKTWPDVRFLDMDGLYNLISQTQSK